MRAVWNNIWIGAWVLAAICGALCAQAQQQEPASQLVREVAYNELHDHAQHGFWRYWVEKRMPQGTRLEQQVETADGTLTRLVLSNGLPLDERTEQEEQARLNRLMKSPQEQASQRQAYAEDERRVAAVLALVPNAFVYEYEVDENGCHRVRFRPNPAYAGRSIDQRVVHAMSGELWVDARMKRVVRLDGHLEENVDFGFGMLGRLYKGGWFRLQRTRVSAAEWKTEKLEVHFNGRAVLFKTIARETSELRGGFSAVPAGMNLAQGMQILRQTEARTQTLEKGRVAPAAFMHRR